MQQNIKDLVTQGLKELYGFDIDEVTLEIPPKKNMGDFAFACFPLAKLCRKSPSEISSDLVSWFYDQDIKKF